MGATMTRRVHAPLKDRFGRRWHRSHNGRIARATARDPRELRRKRSKE
jgi:hypothetical protein